MRKWPKKLSAVQVRLARHTNNLAEITRLYKDGLGLPEIGSFENHNGYSGVMLGLPGFDYHLEFTTHEEQKPLPQPSKEDLLVFYIPDNIRYNELIDHLKSAGYKPWPSENPYWNDNATTFEDPDGRRIVLSNTAGI
ncbi:MAG: putative protein YycE [Candidatus Marinimicrobia bacterium]|nr:putative protein YycE [Candidatus Neomarinimicrobiota bacterium]